jgi:hypothetical protein
MMVCFFKMAMSAALFISLAGGTSLFAQDNIILKNGMELPAKVLEVSASEIKYKKQDNPDGPVYTYTIKDVLLINYANGTKDVFGKPGSAISVAGNDTIPKLNSVVVDQIHYKRRFFASQFETPQGKRLSGDETRSILLLVPNANDSYQRGKALRIGGYLTSAAGLGLIGAGLGLAVLSDGGGSGSEHHGDNGIGSNNTDNERGQDHHNNGDLRDVGFAIAGAGILTGIVGIWLDHRATVQFRRTSERFNTSHPASLHFGPSRKGLGVGLALNF